MALKEACRASEAQSGVRGAIGTIPLCTPASTLLVDSHGGYVPTRGVCATLLMEEDEGSSIVSSAFSVFSIFSAYTHALSHSIWFAKCRYISLPQVRRGTLPLSRCPIVPECTLSFSRRVSGASEL